MNPKYLYKLEKKKKNPGKLPNKPTLQLYLILKLKEFEVWEWKYSQVVIASELPPLQIFDKNGEFGKFLDYTGPSNSKIIVSPKLSK